MARIPRPRNLSLETLSPRGAPARAFMAMKEGGMSLFK
jgi:hypothetical protein